MGGNFGSRIDEESGEQRILDYEETCTAHLVKSRRLQWTGHVAQMGETRNDTEI
jgi:hypothetical protein